MKGARRTRVGANETKLNNLLIPYVRSLSREVRGDNLPPECLKEFSKTAMENVDGDAKSVINISDWLHSNEPCNDTALTHLFSTRDEGSLSQYSLKMFFSQVTWHRLDDP